jgi:hypothetical protein
MIADAGPNTTEIVVVITGVVGTLITSVAAVIIALNNNKKTAATHDIASQIASTIPSLQAPEMPVPGSQSGTAKSPANPDAG